jgi:hypothetical protein
LTSLFARLISHQPAVLFSQDEPATSNQPQPASSTLLSEQSCTSHQQPANQTGCFWINCNPEILIGNKPFRFQAVVYRHTSLFFGSTDVGVELASVRASKQESASFKQILE